MWSYGAFCDEFFISSRLFLKLDLDPSRDTVLHFFEQIRRMFPRMSRLRRRDDGALILDEEGTEAGGRRVLRLDGNALKFSYFSPPDSQAAAEFADGVLKQAPHQLSLSDLDYDYLEACYAFDLEYRGNHDELVAETLFPDHPLLNSLTDDGQRVIDCQPFFGITLSAECDKQVYIEVKGRTSTYELRSGEYEASPLSVYLTVRRYWGFSGAKDLSAANRDLLTTAERYVNERVMPHVVQPLAAAIASRR